MAIEAATYIDTLNASNPLTTDFVAEGDNHIRLLKQVIKATFPNANSPIYFDIANATLSSNTTIVNATDGGKLFPVTANGGNITITLPASPSDRMRLKLLRVDATQNTLTIAGNGKLINSAASFLLRRQWQWVELLYSSVLGGWWANDSGYEPPGKIVYSPASSLHNHVMCDGSTTLGTAASGADLQGDAYRPLYEFVRNNYSDALAPVSGGRGASAAADWAANKTIEMPDYRGYYLLGSDAMGGVAANRVTSAVSGIASAVNSVGGSQSKTIAQANLPAYTLPNTLAINGDQTGGLTRNLVKDFHNVDLSGVTSLENITFSTTTLSLTGSVTSGGSGTAMSIMPPTAVVNTFMSM